MSLPNPYAKRLVVRVVVSLSDVTGVTTRVRERLILRDGPRIRLANEKVDRHKFLCDSKLVLYININYLSRGILEKYPPIPAQFLHSCQYIGHLAKAFILAPIFLDMASLPISMLLIELSLVPINLAYCFCVTPKLFRISTKKCPLLDGRLIVWGTRPQRSWPQGHEGRGTWTRHN